MNKDHLLLIKDKYTSSAGSSLALFQTVLEVARETSLEKALAMLERCVTEKRLAWIDSKINNLERTGNPLRDGLSIFYARYLGLSIPQDGEIVEQSDDRIVTRWWNRCPTLEACVALGLDTRLVCRRAYHTPVDAMLKRIDPRLRFERKYAALRPYTPYCEEILILADDG